MLESLITKKTSDLLKKYRKELGKEFFFYKTSDKFTSGIPDFYILYRGVSAWLELKAQGQKVIEGGLQELTLRRLQQAGAEAIWTREFSEVETLLKSITGVFLK